MIIQYFLESHLASSLTLVSSPAIVHTSWSLNEQGPSIKADSRSEPLFSAASVFCGQSSQCTGRRKVLSDRKSKNQDNQTQTCSNWLKEVPFGSEGNHCDRNRRRPSSV